MNKTKTEQDHVAEILKNDFFRKWYLDSGETVFYPRNPSSISNDTFIVLRELIAKTLFETKIIII